MLVDDRTFEGMEAEAAEVSIDSTDLKIPSLRHLLALKFHALKGAQEYRGLKDLQDVSSLIAANGLDVRDPQFKGLVLKYGNDEIYDKILELCG